MPIINSSPSSTLAPASNPFAGFSAPDFKFQGIPQSVMNQLQTLSSSAPPGAAAGYGAMNTLLTTPPQSMTNTVMPYLQALYGQSASGTLPFLQQQAAQGVANTESEMGQRGLVGSSIEQAGIIGSQAAGQQGINQYIGNMSMQLAQNYMQSVGMDIQSNREMLNNLAQAIGQQLQNNTNYSMFQQGLNSMNTNARRAGQSSIWGSGIGALGSLGGAAILGGMLSDERAKKTIKELKPISFRYKTDSDKSDKRIGFSAQNVEKVFPDSVSKREDGMRVIDLSKFMANLVMILKETHKEIENLKKTKYARLSAVA